jgi:UMF1 family MFS transporter
MTEARRRIWGWFFFDWASQPYNTLLMTFIFAPYMASLLEDGTQAQESWGYGVGAAGFVIAIFAPFLGAIADKTGRRMGFILLFSLMYVVGSSGLWLAAPGHFNLMLVLICFGVGLIGMEFATTFTNAMLPDLGSAEDIGRISGSGWAFGYAGGVLSLLLMLLFFAEGPSGKTLLGIPPLFGLDASEREGTRFVGPFTAIWYVLFMIPFFLWVREPVRQNMLPLRQALSRALPELWTSVRQLPQQRSLFAFLGASMFYRDGLNGIFAIGGIYAIGVLGWSVTQVGVFGILAASSGALFAWLGGKADARFGPRAVIRVCLILMIVIGVVLVLISRDRVLGIPIAPNSMLPDIAFYLVGAATGAVGGILQAASRTMMVVQADTERMTEAFGLYALAGKATSFMAPLSIGLATDLSGSQQVGVSPVIGLFVLGLVLLSWVSPREKL